VQTTLLGIAIAIILALVSALAAPLVIDWNHHRGAFEQEASRLVGVPVRVTGAIDARILPTPHIKLRDVEVGEAGRQPLVHAAAIELEVGLGPLLRGEVRATELRLVAPQINLGLDRTGALDWPMRPPSFRPDALTISRFTVEDGRVTLTDAGSDSRLVLQKLWFNGDVRSFIGPFRGEGAFVVGEELYGYRISAGRSDPVSGLRLRLDVDPTNRPLTAEVEGTLGFDRGVPQFEGTLSLARLVGATLAHGERVMSDPWQLASKLRVTPASASLQDLTLQYGPDERAVNLGGKAELTFGAQPHLDGTISSRQVDVDRALAAPAVTHRLPFVMIPRFFQTFVAAVKPSLPVAVAVNVEAVTVGGTAIQSLHGNVRFDEKGWSFNDFAFRAPGYTEVNLSGRLDDGPKGLSFSGPAKIESADLTALMAWLEGRNDVPAGPDQTLSAHGDVTVASDRFALDRLSATLDQENVEGRLSYAWPAADRPAAIDGELRAANLNVDALAAFAKAALSDGALEFPRQVALVLDVGKATFAGVEARMVKGKIKFDAGVFHIDELSIRDLGGAALNVSGRIDELSSQPRGRLVLDVDATTLAGLTNIAGRLAPEIADAFRPFAADLAPAKVHGVLSVERAAAGAVAKLDLGGPVGAMRLALNAEATGVAERFFAAVVRMTGRLDADDGGVIARLIGLDHVIAVDQLPGQMTISADGPLDGVLRLNGQAAAGGLYAAVVGAVRIAGEQSPTGSLQLKASAADLRPLHQAMTGQPGSAVPVSASAIIGVAGPDLSITDLAVGVGKSSVRGRLDLKLSRPMEVDGDIAADDVDATTIAALVFGLPSVAPGSSAIWSSEPVGVGAFAAGATGSISFKFERAAFTPGLIAHDLKGVVHLRPSEIAATDIDGGLAGGKLTGELTVRHDAESFALTGNAALAGANAAALVGAESAVDGLITLKLQAEGLGLSPDRVVGSLHGSGSIALGDGHFNGIDAAAFDAAVRAVDQSGTVDATKLRAAVGAAMENGRLTVPRADAQVTITGGQVHLVNATLRAQDGDTLSLAGLVDINKAAVDARMILSGQPAANALIPIRPELTVAIKGPVAAPEKSIDVGALIGWLTMRASELQTRRLESIEANRRDEVSGPFVRPSSPSIRFVPPGTALETVDRANVPAPPSPGTRTLDRLRPEAPSRSEGGAAAAATSPAASGIKPAAPRSDSPLDLLFRSQN
jgi:uncharacterized protein involved in outer membrane biogenesis